MIRRLIEWAVKSPLIVILLALALAGGGMYAFLHINVEAYPDPAPAIIEVVAQWPGASAEEMERQVTIPLEVTLAGMPGLTPVISPASPIGEIFRYTLKSPQNALGQDIYTLSDLKALQDWLLEREF